MPKIVCEKKIIASFILLFFFVVGRKYICIFLTECNFGTSGFNCEDKCDTCSNSTCERIDGNCTHGCIGGYSGYQCQLRGMSILEPLTVPEHMSSSRCLVGFLLLNLYLMCIFFSFMLYSRRNFTIVVFVHGIELIRDNQWLACLSRVRWINRSVETKNNKMVLAWLRSKLKYLLA